MNDDEIKKMQEEMDEEKEMGLGLPVSVTSQVAAQSMMQQVAADPEQGGTPPEPQQEDESVQSTFSRLKQIL